MAESTPRSALYRYGPLAWVWRGLLLLLTGGAAAVLLAAPTAWQAWLMVTPLLLPGAFFAWVVVIAIDRDGDRVLVVTLSGLLRRIDCARLGVPTRRTKAYNEGVAVHAPRLWMPVRGGLPLYVDLLGTVPDRRGFERVFGALPR